MLHVPTDSLDLSNRRIYLLLMLTCYGFEKCIVRFGFEPNYPMEGKDIFLLNFKFLILYYFCIRSQNIFYYAISHNT